jgi:hypothetical protein
VRAAAATALTAVKAPLRITRIGLKLLFTQADQRRWRNSLAIKKPYVLELTEELEGEDARRLVEYVHDPDPPEGHDEYLNRCEATFESVYSPRPASELFF